MRKLADMICKMVTNYEKIIEKILQDSVVIYSANKHTETFHSPTLQCRQQPKGDQK